MRYVQSLPPIVEPPPDEGAVRPAARIPTVAPVRERSLPPMIYRPHHAALPAQGINRRWVPRAVNALPDRRLSCRRIRNEPVLQELRSGPDRRRHCQRENDITTAIDEKI